MTLSVISKFVSDVEDSINALRSKGEALLAWFGSEAKALPDEVYDDLKIFFGAVAPATMANFTTVFNAVVADMGGLVLDYLTGKPDEDVIEDVLNKAEQFGVAELKTLSTPTLKLLISLKAQAAQALADAEAAVR